MLDLSNVNYCNLGDTYAFIDEGDYNDVRDYLEEHDIPYRATADSYVGIYMLAFSLPDND